MNPKKLFATLATLIGLTGQVPVTHGQTVTAPGTPERAYTPAALASGSHALFRTIADCTEQAKISENYCIKAAAVARTRLFTAFALAADQNPAVWSDRYVTDSRNLPAMAGFAIPVFIEADGRILTGNNRNSLAVLLTIPSGTAPPSSAGDSDQLRKQSMFVVAGAAGTQKSNPAFLIPEDEGRTGTVDAALLAANRDFLLATTRIRQAQDQREAEQWHIKAGRLYKNVEAAEKNFMGAIKANRPSAPK